MTQSLPTNDTFTEGADPYGSTVVDWMRTLPYQAAIVSTVTTGHSVGWLTSGYFSGTSGPAGVTKDTGHDRVGITHIWRREIREDGEVRLNWESSVESGTPTANGLNVTGVFGRVKGGVPTQPSSIYSREYWDDPDGYWYGVIQDSGTQRVVLLRIINGSVDEVLASMTEAEVLEQHDTAPTTAAGIAPNQTMKMKIVTNGSQVDIDCSRIGAVGDPTGVFEDFNGTVSDTHANRITGAGRWGFTLQPVHNATGGTASTIANWVSVHQSDGTQIMRDEWDRVLLTAGRNVSSELGAPSGLGFALNGGYSGDQAGRVTAQNHCALLERRASNNMVQVGGAPLDTATGGEYGWFCSTRPASFEDQQHRSLSVTFLAGAPDNQEAGIHLFGGWSNDTANANMDAGSGSIDGSGSDPCKKRGYLFRLIRDTGTGDFSLELRHYRVTDSVVLATCDQAQLTSDGISISTGTAVKIQMEVVRKGPGGGEYNWINCKVGGTGPTWTLASGIGELTLSSGAIIDSRSEPTTSGGSVEGFFLRASETSTGPYLYADSWTQEAFTDDTGTPAEDQASIAVTSETAGKTGTLTVPLSWPVSVSYTRKIGVHPYETGHVARVALESDARRVWEVQMDAATSAEVASLLSFWDSHDGTEIPFDWENDEGETVAVRFLDDEMGDTLRTVGTHRYRFRLLELFD